MLERGVALTLGQTAALPVAGVVVTLLSFEHRQDASPTVGQNHAARALVQCGHPER